MGSLDKTKKLFNELDFYLKDTHKESTPSNKTQAHTKSMNMGIWKVVTLCQLLITDSYIEIKFKKKKVVNDKSPFFVIGLFCTPCCICLNPSHPDAERRKN